MSEQDKAAPEAAGRNGALTPVENKPSVIGMKDGMFEPRDSSELHRTMTLYVQGGMLPRQFLPAPDLPVSAAVARAVHAHQMLTSLGVNPLTYLRFVAFVRGTPMLWGDLPLTLVMRSGKMQGMPLEYQVTTDGKRISLENGNFREPVFGAVCEVRIKGDEERHRRIFTLDDAAQAGLNKGSSDSAWSKYPTRMLQLKARGWLIKDLFPDVLCGAQQLEYDGAGEMPVGVSHGGTGASRVARPAPAANSLNDIYRDDEA